MSPRDVYYGGDDRANDPQAQSQGSRKEWGPKARHMVENRSRRIIRTMQRASCHSLRGRDPSQGVCEAMGDELAESMRDALASLT